MNQEQWNTHERVRVLLGVASTITMTIVHGALHWVFTDKYMHGMPTTMLIQVSLNNLLLIFIVSPVCVMHGYDMVTRRTPSALTMPLLVQRQHDQLMEYVRNTIDEKMQRMNDADQATMEAVRRELVAIQGTLEMLPVIGEKYPGVGAHFRELYQKQQRRAANSSSDGDVPT